MTRPADPAPVAPATPGGRGSARRRTADRDLRLVGRYFRWSLYTYVVAEALQVAGVALGRGYTVSAMTWVGVVATIVHAALSVAVARWAFGQRTRPGPWPRRLVAAWTLAALVAIAGVVPWTSPRTPWPITIPMVLLVSLVMVSPLFRWRHAMMATGAMALVVLALAALFPAPPAARVAYALWGIVLSAFFLLSGWSFAWVLGVLEELRDARRAEARLAVADERLRISRDLHDVFGRTLATIAVKSELAAQLVRRDRPDDAYAELAEIRSVSDAAGKEVRRVVRGEVDVRLAQELVGARALLDSAGIATTVAGDAEDVPPAVAGVLGWVVREAVTNVLRHSRATQASVSVSTDGDEVTLMVANDGADVTGTSGTRTGIDAMRDRLAPFAGTVETTHEGGWFTLVATATPPIEGTAP